MKVTGRDRVKAAALLAATAGFVACRTTQDTSDAKDTQVIPFEGELGMQPGIGFESVFEDVRGKCVEYDGTEPLTNAQTVTYKVSMIEKSRDLGVELAVSNAMSIKGAVPDTPATISAKTRFALGAQYTLNRYSIYLLAKVEVRNETTQLKNPRIKDSVKNALAAANSNPGAIDTFRLQCGDSYLGAYTTGGEFFGVIEMETDSEEQKLQMKREVEAAIAAEGVGEASTQQSLELKLTNAVKNKKLKIWTYQKGGTGAAQVGLVDTPQLLLERIRNFPTFVQPGAAAAAYTATFKDYFTLELPLTPEYRDALINAQDVMAELAGITTQLIDRRADIQYVLDHPNSFKDFTTPKRNELIAARTATNDLLKKLYKAARDCHNKFRDCRKPDEAALPALTLPERKTTAVQLTGAGITIRTKLENVDPGAFYDFPFNPPECFVEVRAVAPNGRYKRLRRTPTVYDNPRCQNLTHNFDLPDALLTETFKFLGTDNDNGEIEVLVMEDDPGTVEEVVGRFKKKYKDIREQSAALDTLTGPAVTVGLEYEVH